MFIVQWSFTRRRTATTDAHVDRYAATVCSFANTIIRPPDARLLSCFFSSGSVIFNLADRTERRPLISISVIWIVDLAGNTDDYETF